MNPKNFVQLVENNYIQGYSEQEFALKEEWLKTGRRILKQLAKELNLPKDSYEVRINRAGVAVSGDIVLHGEWVYVVLSQSSASRTLGFCWRFCKGRKDYTGDRNQWASWQELLNLHRFANKILEQKP